MSDSTQAIEWYLARDGQQHGPVSEPELRKIIELGYLRPTDLVWRQGWPDWQPATAVLPPPGTARPVAPPPAAPKPESVAPAPAHPSGGAPAANPAPHVRLDPEPAQTHRQGGYAAAGAAARQEAPYHDPGQGRRPADASGHGSASRQREALADEHTVPHFQPHPAAVGRPQGVPGPAAGDPAARGAYGVGTETAQRWDPQARRHDGPGMSPHRRQPGAGSPHPAPAAPQPVRPPAPDMEEEEERGGFPWRAAAVLVVLAALAGGGFALYKSGQLTALPFLGAPSVDGKVPVVSAPSSPVREASRDNGRAPAAGPSAASGSIEITLQRSPLWQLLRTSFPDWYNERLAEVRRQTAESKDEREVMAGMMQAVVDLRRKHNAEALQASPPRLKAIAASFVDNLNRLSRHSTAACYGFISQGEASPAVTGIGTGDLRAALDAQLVSIFEAVVEGRQTPTKHAPPRREDYDILTAELGKRGWSASDLQTFSDARALARAAPEKVCQMVNDWFAAQLEVKDEAAQTRLLSEALKPVVAG
ncbi:MAG: GYF domain-containing protein [Hyphomicrobiaceae bacterium]|nr:GYF domain-containing protein [Hyphomicrobiaceae bacterium]